MYNKHRSLLSVLSMRFMHDFKTHLTQVYTKNTFKCLSLLTLFMSMQHTLAQTNNTVAPLNKIENIVIDGIGQRLQTLSVETSLNQSNQITLFNQFKKNINQSQKIEIINGSPSFLSYELIASNSVNYTLQAKLSHNQQVFQVSFIGNNLTQLANRLADFIYQSFTGKRGIFSTRLSYVLKKDAMYQLVVANSDGTNAHTALRSKQPIISVSWSPNGQYISYVSFEQQKPVIYIHHLATGKRDLIANYSGSNSAPSWSADGKSLAMVLTKDGHSQIYRYELNSKVLERLSNSIEPVIDTEPVYSPDGQFIYFTSDRSSTPQIYRMSVQGERFGKAKRLTFSGSENLSPKVSSDGKLLTYVSKQNGYQVVLHNLNTNKVQVISQTSQDENPNFSANDDYVIYSTRLGAQNRLVGSDLNGRTFNIETPLGHVVQPAWGPFTD